jgi:hypothetical protein
MLEPFLRHIFRFRQFSADFDKHCPRSLGMESRNSGDRPCRWVFMLIPVHTASSRRINLAARNFASISATADNRCGSVARPKADFRRSSAGSIRAAPCRSAVALPVGATFSASSSESRLCANARALVPLIVVAAARGSAQPSALRLYQGLVRAFQRRGKAYELRCGQLYGRTIAAFADRR